MVTAPLRCLDGEPVQSFHLDEKLNSAQGNDSVLTNWQYLPTSDSIAAGSQVAEALSALSATTFTWQDPMGPTHASRKSCSSFSTGPARLLHLAILSHLADCLLPRGRLEAGYSAWPAIPRCRTDLLSIHALSPHVRTPRQCANAANLQRDRAAASVERATACVSRRGRLLGQATFC